MKHILIVEDDLLLRKELVLMLEEAGYFVTSLDSFMHTTEEILHSQADLLVLDINLPYKSGFQICREIKRQSSIPLLMLTSREEMKDEILALKLGADEYLTKPFRKERLLARIENLLKRFEGRKNLLKREDFLLDRNTYTLYVYGNSYLLAQNQGKLLEAFLTSKEAYVNREELSLCLWGTVEYIDENALQVNISRLRKVLGKAAPNYKIECLRDKGYRLVKVGKNEK